MNPFGIEDMKNISNNFNGLEMIHFFKTKYS